MGQQAQRTAGGSKLGLFEEQKRGSEDAVGEGEREERGSFALGEGFRVAPGVSSGERDVGRHLQGRVHCPPLLLAPGVSKHPFTSSSQATSAHPTSPQGLSRSNPSSLITTRAHRFLLSRKPCSHIQSPSVGIHPSIHPLIHVLIHQTLICLRSFALLGLFPWNTVFYPSGLCFQHRLFQHAIPDYLQLI